MRTHRIRAAVLRGSWQPLSIESLEMEGPRADEVLVRIVASGVCHTDISFCEFWEAEDPVVLGHEGAGIVEETGEAVKGLKPGDHVVLSYQSCGHCSSCRSGHPADCNFFYELNFGFQRIDGSNALHRSGVRGHFFGQSSFATHSLATERNLVRVPKNLSLEMLAPLGCGMQTGSGTVMNSLKVRAGKSIMILGTGSVGLAAVMAARIKGAAPVIGVDINAMRLRMALQLGATHVIDPRRKSLARAIRAITGKGVDYAVETTGLGAMLEAAIELLNPHGRAAYLTGAAGRDDLPEGRKVLSVIQGDAVPQRFIPRLISLNRSGQFPFERLVKFYSFADINQAISESRSGSTIKPVLRVSGT